MIYCDERLKNFDGLYNRSLDDIKEMKNKVKKFTFRDNIYKLKGSGVGIPIDDLSGIIGEAIRTDENGYKYYISDYILFALVNALNEFYDEYINKINEIEARLDNLETRVTILEAR